MPLLFNIRQTEQHNLHLAGELPISDLDVDLHDDVIQPSSALHYRLEIQKLGESVLVRGELRLPVACVCVRCLSGFNKVVSIPEWTCHLPLQGEDAVVVMNDLVDLTPFLRDDILLELPQHPLCKPDCGGLSKAPVRAAELNRSTTPADDVSSVWAELDRLKL